MPEWKGNNWSLHSPVEIGEPVEHLLRCPHREYHRPCGMFSVAQIGYRNSRLKVILSTANSRRVNSPMNPTGIPVVRTVPNPGMTWPSGTSVVNLVQWISNPIYGCQRYFLGKCQAESLAPNVPASSTRRLVPLASTGSTSLVETFIN
jgi:hypothetical protein